MHAEEKKQEFTEKVVNINRNLKKMEGLNMSNTTANPASMRIAALLDSGSFVEIGV